MTAALDLLRPQLPAMSGEAIAKVATLERALKALPQVPIRTSHVLHGGLYCRTIRIPAGVALTGALVKIATVLILRGDATVFIGGDALRLTGYHVLPAGAGRKQAFVAHEDTDLTLVFPSHSESVEEAEWEFTDDAADLMSRQQPGMNDAWITGE